MSGLSEKQLKILLYQLAEENEYWRNITTQLSENGNIKYINGETGSAKKLEIHFTNQVEEMVDKICRNNKNAFMVLVNTVISVFYSNYANLKSTVINYYLEPDKYVNNPGAHVIMNLEVDPDSSIRDLLNQNKNIIQSALSYANYPIDLFMQEELPKQITLNQYIDVNVALNIEPEEFNLDTFTFAFQYGEKLSFSIYFEEECYTESEISYVVSLYQKIWELCVKDLSGRVQDIRKTLQHSEEKLKEWNSTEHIYSKEQKLIDVFEEQVLKTPDRIAICGKGFSLTYDELNRKANSLAHTLRKENIGSDDVVGIMLPRSAEMMVGIYGILKAGGAYMPIDPAYPQTRINYILENSQCKKVLTLKEYSRQISNRQLSMYLDDSEVYSGMEENLEHIGGSHDLAYIIYTSGTTGNPKGAMIENHSVINRIEWMQSAYGLTEQDVIIQKTPFTFDVSVWELFWWMFVGAKLYLLEPGEEKNPVAIVDAIQEQKITTMHFVPSMLNAFLEYISETGTDGLESVKKVFASGEELQVNQVNRFIRLLGDHKHLINLYGPTEATVDVTHFPCYLKKKYDRIYIGKPVHNTRIYIVDKENQPVPIGNEGELCIAGVQLARGYLNNEALTNEKFICDPFNEESRIYKTGDLARWTEQGNIEYLGRIDSQVKIRGFRIELGEITIALRNHPSIKDAVVIARKDYSANKFLCAYVIPKAGVNPFNRKGLVKYLEDLIPSYMVPDKFYEIDAFPLSLNGKLDIKKLPIDGEIRDERVYVAPEGEKEILMVDIWKQVLNLERVGVCEDFFSLGGNSIHFISVLAKIKGAGYHFSFQDLYKYSTIRKLCEHLTEYEEEENIQKKFDLLKPEDIKIAETMRNVEDIYPLSYLQAGLIYQGEINKGSSQYHDIITQRIRGKFEEDVFQRALDEMVKKHPIFRSAYDLVTFSEYVQIVYKEMDHILTVDNLSQLTKEGQEAAVETYLEGERKYIFKWSQGGLIRIHIDILNEEEYYYHLSFSDTALDGWSINLIHSELFRIYYEMIENKYETDDIVDNHLRNYIKLEQDILKSEEAKEYWSKILHDAPKIEIPKLQKESGLCKIIMHNVLIPEELSEKLLQLSESLGIPVKNILMAAHIKVLSVLSNEQTVTTGYEHSGRPELYGADKAIGLFLNTIPFRIDLIDSTWLDLIQTVYQRESELLPYRRYPMAVMKSDSGNYSSNIFEVVFNFTHFYVLKELKKLDGFDLLDVKASAETEFCYRAEFCQNYFTDMVELSIHYYANLFSNEQITTIGQYYINVLTMMTENINQRHNARSICSEEEIAKLADFEGDTLEIPMEDTFWTYFNKSVSTKKEKAALICEDTVFTYEELDRKVNQIANSLLKRGVQKQSMVCVMLDRSIEWAVTVLAVWKIGGIYIPVESDVPIHRFDSIVTKSGCKNVIYSQKQVLDFYILGKTEIQFMNYEEMAEEIGNDTVLENCVDGNDKAYIIFTSGTTGEPKGAIIQHKGMINHLLAKKMDLELTEQEVIVQNASKSFDISIWQLVEAFIIGASTVIIKDSSVMDIKSFSNVLVTAKVSILEVVPSYLEILIDYCKKESINYEFLRYVLVTGEAFKKTLAEEWFAVYPNIKMVNAYGPTEASDDITHYILDKVPDWSSVLVGKPIRNTRIDILDSYQNQVPVGSAGQVFVTGCCVGAGYIGNLEQTALVFSETKKNGQKERMYATGDIGRYLTDGNIELYGRIDEQVKVRGFRIELNEIERNILMVDGVNNVIVLVHKNRHENELVAFIKIAGDVDVVAINDFIQNRIPFYMIPSKYIIIDEIPVTPNGKIDKRNLLNRVSEVTAIKKKVKKPITPAEHKIAEIAKDILGLEEVSMTDNFFDLGGNSLLAMKFVIKLAGEISISSIINNPQLGSIAHILQNSEETDTTYLVPYRNNAYTEYIFIGIPYAGGNAMAFDNTFLALREKKEEVSLFTLNLERMEEINELITGALRELAKHGNPKTVVYIWGHCSGAAIALELARRLKEENLTVGRVYIGGKLLKDKESYIQSNLILADMKEDEVKEWLVEETGFEGFLNAPDEMIQKIVKHFKRDSYWCNEYLGGIRKLAEQFKNIPVTAVYSNDDPLTKGYQVQFKEWENISSQFSYYEICKNKGHYFIATAASDIVEILEQTII